MKRYLILLILIIVSFWLLLAIVPGKGEHRQQLQQVQQAQDVQSGGTNKGALRPDINFGKVPLYFVANQGQVNEKAFFYAKASRYTLWLTKEGLVFDSTHPAPSGHPSQERHTPPFGHPSQEGNYEHPYSPRLTKIERDVSRLVFLDANKNPEVVPVEESKLRVNYFKGKDKSQWHCDIPTSQAVLYKSLYKNIDLKVYGIEKEIEYDWIVKPGGNPEDIRFQYKNVKGTRLEEEGNLLIETDFGELMHKKPVSFQGRTAQGAGRKAQSTGVGAGLRACPQERKDVKVTFKKIAENTYGFEVGEYDKSRELIIDPVVLAYSTYLGGGDSDRSHGIAVDESGCVYVAGTTYSWDFPILDQYREYSEYTDIFLTKLDTNKSGATSLIYSTYLGGDSLDYGYGIAVDDSGCVYVTGYTDSSDFPTLNQYQGYQGYRDAFLTKLDTSKSGASSLIYSTYLGGGGDDFGMELAVDGSGCVYVTGFTSCSDFPTLNQYQEYQRKGDAFLTKLDTTKSGVSCLIYSTYLGSEGNDRGYGIAVDGSGCAYVTGYTESSDFPTRHQYQEYQGYEDAFLTKLDTTKSGVSSLIYSTFLGGNDNDRGLGMAVDSSGRAYVTGFTESSDFPIRNQYQVDQGSNDAFLTKLDTTKSGSSSLIYSTYLGGEWLDYGIEAAVDDSGCAYVTGYTSSRYFPIANQFQGDQGDEDVFITKLDTTKSGSRSLIYSTYLGGITSDIGRGIVVDGSGSVYVTGYTGSSDFPILGQYQLYRANWDAFITKLVLCTKTSAIRLNRDALYFSAVNGGPQTGAQSFALDISGGCGMQWTASCLENWIEVTPKNAIGSALVTVSVDTRTLAPGTYTGTVFITYGSASDSVTINLTIYDAASTSVPFGQFSTPLDASVARGSIPVTGWVLDDMEVESVKIYRDSNIYVGDAVFVDGARPDVEAAFPTYPFNYRAGWGYMLLTNFLPNGGNGTHTLYVSATDVEGNTVTLGAKTIICDNANAVKPFGTIDTPAQGGTASGPGYINWGWALTPRPNSIPFDGSTIHVWVDGVKIGNPVYNIFRSDIASLFPGYANSGGAAGYFSLDTTAYANGVHTIQWTVTDSGGNFDGIGSRYFNIQNSGSAARVLNVQGVRRSLFHVEPGQLPIDDSNPITVKKGNGWNMEPQKVYPDDNGIITVETRELERVVIHLDEPSTDSSPPVPSSHVSPTDSYIYLNTGGRLRPLPIGSKFDGERDIFYWQPGPGFIGEYNFVFIKKGPGGEWHKKIIRVVINPGL